MGSAGSDTLTMHPTVIGSASIVLKAIVSDVGHPPQAVVATVR